MRPLVHDQLAKGILEETLSLGGKVAVDYQLSAERQWIDILFTPTIDPLPQRLGLLGQLPPQVMTLFEPFRNAVSKSQVISCQLKLAILIAEQERKAKRDKKTLPFAQLPFLWILTPTASQQFLEDCHAQPRTGDWPQGVYELPKVQRTGIIAIHHLPKQPDTLWLRLLGRDQVQQKAMEELRQLDGNDPLRECVLELTYDFLALLEARQRQQAEDLDPEERVLFMQLTGLYQKRITEERHQGRQEGEQEGWQKGWQKGRQEGEQAERHQTIENILSLRFDTIDPQLEAIVEPLMALPSADALSMLMQLSKADLIERFG